MNKAGQGAGLKNPHNFIFCGRVMVKLHLVIQESAD